MLYTALGDGTPISPILISSIDGLAWIGDNESYWNANYKQTCDIDASITSTWNDGKGFLPICYKPGSGAAVRGGKEVEETAFCGVYNGDFYEIKNLFIDNDEICSAGLFYALNEASISTLSMIDVNFTARYNMGALTGYSSFSNIINCSATGSISGQSYIGGLVGNTYETEVENCFTNITITGDDRLGGLVASIGNSNIDNCYTRGSIEGTSDIGGLVYNCYKSSITNCYSTSQLSGEAEIGGLVFSEQESSIENSFWDIQASLQDLSAGGTGLTTIQMCNVTTYTSIATSGLDTAWDFANNPNNDLDNNDYWNINSVYNDGYPYLAWQNFGATLEAPQNLAISLSDNTLNLSWNAVAGASTYIIYSADTPNGDFTIDNSGTFTNESWAAPLGAAKKFYYVKATN